MELIMKIAIVTLVGEYNNGNRLQNYALQQTLKKIMPNAQIETININYNCSPVRKIKQIIKNCIKIFIKKYRQPSLKNFRIFNKNYIQFSAKKYDENYNFQKIANDYDFFVTGSDQVWNLNFITKNPDFYFLNFVPTEKKLSYAASIGMNSLDHNQAETIKNYLKTFQQISVRENKAQKMLEDIGLTNIETHLDPTLLLTKEEWNLVAKKPIYELPNKYILLCMLGTISDEYRQKIKEISVINQIPIINMFDKNTKGISESGPSEFVYLIKNASLVITDSFHATVFSLIYKTPIIHASRLGVQVFQNMTSRMKNLEDLFKIKLFELNNINVKNQNYLTPPSQEIDSVIDKERKKSLDYLQNILKNTN